MRGRREMGLIGHTGPIGRGWSRRPKLQREREPRGVAPEVLQGVETALLLVEDMDDDVGVIDDDPVAHGVAVDSGRRELVLRLEAGFDLAGNSLEVRLGGAAANDEEIGKTRNSTKIQGDKIFRLLVRRELRAARSQFFARQDEMTPR